MRGGTFGKKAKPQVSKRSDQGLEHKPWKLLLWAAVAGLVFGLIGFGEVAEDWLRVSRNSFHRHKASGQVVILKIDDKSLHEIGNWPWPRSTDGALVERLTAVGVKRIFFDVNFSFPSNSRDDRALADALRNSGRVTLFTRSRSGIGRSAPSIVDLPLPELAANAHLGVASFHYNYQNAVWQVPYSAHVGQQTLPSFASAIANVTGPPGSEFRVDYSIKPDTIPSYSAGDVLTGAVGAKQLAGKDVLIGISTDVVGDSYFIPGYGKSFGVNVHAIAAETLKAGTPIDLGWIPGFLLGFVAAAAALFRKRFAERLTIFVAAFLALLVGPLFLESRLIFADVTPGLFILLTVATALAWRRYRTRGYVNPISNLPNLSALHANRVGPKQALVAARILNYEEIVAALPPNSERQARAGRARLPIPPPPMALLGD